MNSQQQDNKRQLRVYLLWVLIVLSVIIPILYFTAKLEGDFIGTAVSVTAQVIETNKNTGAKRKYELLIEFKTNEGELIKTKVEEYKTRDHNPMKKITVFYDPNNPDRVMTEYIYKMALTFKDMANYGYWIWLFSLFALIALSLSPKVEIVERR
ncbi:MAG: DUF3592 domain-containing protein [Alphaproteobacteria bacterium]|nr:DUF3592 domain-containing protein [Alphaproteobacteria bacterium]